MTSGWKSDFSGSVNATRRFFQCITHPGSHPDHDDDFITYVSRHPIIPTSLDIPVAVHHHYARLFRPCPSASIFLVPTPLPCRSYPFLAQCRPSCSSTPRTPRPAKSHLENSITYPFIRPRPSSPLNNMPPTPRIRLFKGVLSASPWTHDDNEKGPVLLPRTVFINFLAFTRYRFCCLHYRFSCSLSVFVSHCRFS